MVTKLGQVLDQKDIDKEVSIVDETKEAALGATELGNLQLIKKAKDSILDDKSGADPYSKHLKINHGYLARFSFFWALASSIQLGWIISETGQIGFIFDVQLEWGAQAQKGQIVNMITVLVLLGTIGNAIGSYLSGIITPKFGIRKTIIFCNVLSLLFNLMRMILTTPTVMIGRFLFGISVAF